MKEYIDITDTSGKSKRAEVIVRFKDEDNNNHYIIYKINGNYFAAKYDDIIGASKLDTNLSEDELKVLEELLNKIPEA